VVALVGQGPRQQIAEFRVILDQEEPVDAHPSTIAYVPGAHE
jgi:hypothetical protein